MLCRFAFEQVNAEIHSASIQTNLFTLPHRLTSVIRTGDAVV
jgi:hypothetical protein